MRLVLLLVATALACGESRRTEGGSRASAGAESGSGGTSGEVGVSGSPDAGGSVGGAGAGRGGAAGALSAGGGGGTAGNAGRPMGGSAGAGTGSGGSSGGGSAAGGEAGSGAGAAGVGGDCSAAIDAEYCAVITGHCPSDTYTREQCQAVAAGQRCGYASSCVEEQNAVQACGASGTPVCEEGYTYASGIDCIDESAAFYQCVGWVWSCTNETTRCYCTHVRPEEATGDRDCTSTFDCCFTDLFGVSCGCYEQAVCDITPDTLRPRVPSCPLP